MKKITILVISIVVVIMVSLFVYFDTSQEEQQEPTITTIIENDYVINNYWNLGFDYRTGQTWQVSEPFELTSIDVTMYSNDGTGVVILDIYKVEGNEPTGSSLSSSEIISTPTTLSWVNIEMPQIMIEVDTEYCFVITSNGDTTVHVAYDNSNTYDGGTMISKNGPGNGWQVNHGYDQRFRIYGYE